MTTDAGHIGTTPGPEPPTAGTALVTVRGRASQRHEDAPKIALAVALAVAVQVALAAGVGPLATIAGFLVLAVAFLWPLTGFATLLLLVPLRHPVGYGPMDFQSLLALTVLLAASLRIVRTTTVRLDLMWASLIAFVGLGALQVLFTPSDFLGEQRTFAELQLFALIGGSAMMLTAQHFLRDRDWAPFLDCMIVGAVVASALVIAVVVTEGAAQAALPGIYGEVQLLRERPSGPFNLPNYFGIFGALAVLLALHRASIASGWQQAAALAATAWIGAAVVLSYSRGALVALAAGLIYLAFSKSKRLGVVVAAALLLVGVVGSGAFYEARLSTTNPNAFTDQARLGLEGSDEGRFAGGAVSIQLFQRDPLFGIGLGQYHFVSRLYVSGTEATYSHNWYLNVLAEQGLIGVVLLLVFAVALISGIRRARSDRRTVALAVLIAYGVGNLSTEAPTNLSASAVAWLVLGGALATAGLTIRRGRAPLILRGVNQRPLVPEGN